MISLCCTKEEVEKVLNYIGEDYKAIPYLYVDVEKYGIGTENVKTWIDKENECIQGVYLLYFDCLHFYTKNNEKYDMDCFMEMKNHCAPKIIMVQEEFGKRLEKTLTTGFDVEKNRVIEMSHIKNHSNKFKSIVAEREDIEGIVDLLLIDDLYTAVFSKEVLLKQMLERFDDDFSRYTVVKDQGKIVATCSTYGESDRIALIGSVIVHPDYRHMGLAADVEYYTCKLMIDEGRTNIGFVNINNTPSINLHLKIGWIPISTLYKFVSKSI